MSHHEPDDLDQRLSRAGEAWRAEHHAPEPEIGDLRRRPAWVVPVAAAASVALLAGGAVLVASQLDADRADAPPAGTTEERWDPDLPPGLLPAEVPGAVPPVNQSVQFPGAEAAGTYTPRVWDAAGAPICGADDVRLSAQATGAPGAVTLTLTAKDADVRCSQSYYPMVQFLSAGKYVEVLTDGQDPRAGDWPTSVLVTAGQSAVLRAGWVGFCEDQGPGEETMEVVFDDNSVARVAAPVTPGCEDTDFSDDKLHAVSWEPEGFTFERRDTFGPIEATLVDTVTGPGGLPTWVVELTAARDVLLDTCPSWEVRQGEEQSASWRLNCDGVPDHKSDGRPYLPAGKPVRFAVWTSYGDTDAPLTWVLTTPDGPVTLPLSDGPAAPTGEPRRVSEREANVHLYLGVGFDDPVMVSLSIDGTRVVDESFESRGQDAPEAVQLAVPAGDHTVVVESATGARRELRFRVPAAGDRWVNLEVWDDPAQDGRGSIEWRVQDSPMMFG